MLLLLNRVFPRGGLLLHLMVQSRLLLVLQLIRMRTIYRLRTRLINVDSFFGNMLVVRWGDLWRDVLTVWIVRTCCTNRKNLYSDTFA